MDLIDGVAEVRVAVRGGGGGTGRLVNTYRLSINCKFFKNIFALNYMQGFCQVSATEASDPLPGTKEEGELPRQVGFWLLDTFCHYRRWARFWSLLCLSS